MKRKFVIVFATIFILSILFSYLFGGYIRNLLSAQVEVMSPTIYTFSDGISTLSGLSSTCYHTTDTGTHAFIIEEKNDTGEKAYFAKKIDVIIGRSDIKCVELLKSKYFNAMYICLSDKNIHDGDRVVISKIHNSP